MKIGILTFHRALNYGAVLQCYALYETLKGNGHDVEVIDYRPPYIEKYRRIYYERDFNKLSAINKIKFIIKLPLIYWCKRKATKAFDSFLFQHFHFSQIVKTTSDLPSYYDIIFFGSDQIWSPEICEGFDLIYWGQFFKGKTRFITYAASYGGHNEISEVEREQIFQYCKAFDSISVREKNLYNELITILNRPISLVTDPTLLLKRESFDKLAIKPKSDKYVLLFMLEKCDGAIDFAKRVALERNCKVIRISAIPSLKKMKNGIIQKGALSPAEFLGYFKFADFIVSVSYHGTAFSVIFNKDFYVVHSKMEDRAYNLLESVGLANRLVKPDEVSKITFVDHTHTDVLIEQQRNKSISFLDITLNDNKNE